MENTININQEKVQTPSMIRCVNRNVLKELSVALQRTPRWGVYIDSCIETYYKELTPRKKENNETDENHVEYVLSDLNKSKRNDAIENTRKIFNKENNLTYNPILPGTLIRDGETKSHTKENVRIAKKYGVLDKEAGLLTQDQLELLHLAVWLHDIGEAVRGDVVIDQKNQSSEDLERQYGEIILKKLIKPEFHNTPVMEKIQEAYKINFDKTHPLHQFFRNYEICSYLNGAIIAKNNPKSIEKSAWLVHNVLIRQMPQLLNLIPTSPSVAGFVKDHMDDIESLFDFVNSSDFLDQDEKRDGGISKEKKDSFVNASQDWAMIKEGIQK